MLANYTQHGDGVIEQIKKSVITYDLKYIQDRYDTYKVGSINISHLRLGFLTGVLGRKPQSITDVGYGNGDFLRLCAEAGIVSFGIEINGYQIPDNVVKIDNFNDAEVTTFFDTLEHFENIYDPCFLNIGSKYLFITVPECHYFSDEWFNTWKHRRENEHLWHFNKLALTNWASKLGYQLLASSNIEDIIRKPENKEISNTLSCVFKRI